MLGQSLNISDEYLSTAVNGMVGTEFFAGQPFGGCAILDHKSLSKFITIKSISKRFFCNFTYLLLSVDPVDLRLSTYTLWYFSKP